MQGFSAGVYNLLKFLHIGAAILWVGTGLFFQIHGSRLRRAKDPLKLAGFARDVAFYGGRLFPAASLSVLILGIVMVIYHPGWGFTDAWIWLGLVGFGLTFVTGMFFLGPTSARIAKITEQRGQEDPEVQAGIRTLFTVSRIDQVVLVGVVADMVFKPGL